MNLRSAVRRLFITWLLPFSILGLMAMAVGCTYSDNDLTDVKASQPNSFLIAADDLGYNELPSTGSEIGTPNIDAPADVGSLRTDLHAAPSCSISQSILLTGVDGYEGHLPIDCVTYPEIMQAMIASEFHTMTVKWHLGYSASH